MLGLNAYEGEVGRLALLSRARDAEALVQYVLAAAQQRGLQVTESWASQINEAVSLLGAWEQNTSNANWPSAAGSIEAKINGVRAKALAFQTEILTPQKDIGQSAVTSAGTMVIDTTKQSPQQVAMARDAAIKAQAEQAARMIARTPVAAPGTSTAKVALIVGALVIAGLGAMYLFGRSRRGEARSPLD